MPSIPADHNIASEARVALLRIKLSDALKYSGARADSCDFDFKTKTRNSSVQFSTNQDRCKTKKSPRGRSSGSSKRGGGEKSADIDNRERDSERRLICNSYVVGEHVYYIHKHLDDGYRACRCAENVFIIATSRAFHNHAAIAACAISAAQRKRSKAASIASGCIMLYAVCIQSR